MKIDNLLIVVTFHYIEERLDNLLKISSQFKLLADRVNTVIVTNTSDEQHQKKISDIFDSQVELFVPESLTHPYRLTWCHFEIFKDRFKKDSSITHFMYLEDDMLIQPNNISYWLKGREDLKSFGLIPSFCRYELRDNLKFSVDNVEIKKLEELKSISVTDEYAYVNLIESYQAMYLLDRELAEEHLFDPDTKVSKWYGNINDDKWAREQAAQGMIFTNIPADFISRCLVGFNKIKRKIDPDALIHHTTNNYTTMPNTKHGKTLVDDLIL